MVGYCVLIIIVKLKKSLMQLVALMLEKRLVVCEILREYHEQLLQSFHETMAHLTKTFNFVNYKRFKLYIHDILNVLSHCSDFIKC